MDRTVSPTEDPVIPSPPNARARIPNSFRKSPDLPLSAAFSASAAGRPPARPGRHHGAPRSSWAPLDRISGRLEAHRAQSRRTSYSPRSPRAPKERSAEMPQNQPHVCVAPARGILAQGPVLTPKLTGNRPFGIPAALPLPLSVTRVSFVCNTAPLWLSLSC